jgi:HAD superfamily hydrolase (TIGR01484 family)
MIGTAQGAGFDRRQRRPRPLADWPVAARAGLLGVMTDIDDTLTREGAIEPAALAALHDLAAAQVPVIAITGRPAGWSEPCARSWPVAAIVAENGATAWIGGRLEFAQDAATREHNAQRLRAVATRILRELPGTQLAQDSAGRLTDIAVDHSEFTQLDPAGIARVVALMQAEGMHATVSSIHINGWFGNHDKVSGAAWMLQRLWGRDLAAEIGRWAYVGDSTNDQAMFARFPHSVGVANLMRFERELHTWPAWITRAERGLGFAEFAAAVLAAR